MLLKENLGILSPNQPVLMHTNIFMLRPNSSLALTGMLRFWVLLCDQPWGGTHRPRVCTEPWILYHAHRRENEGFP